MKILVTGAAGFIGFHTCREFLKQGHTIVGVDIMSSYYSIEIKEARLDLLMRHKNFHFERVDISNRKHLEELFAKTNFDSVIHLAAQPGVRVSFADSENYSKANLLGFGNILQCVTQFQVPVFMYASSSSIYGNAREGPFSEKTTTPEPINFYGGTKLSNEVLVKSSIGGTNTTAIGLRFFTVYGPWGRPDMAYFKILLRNVTGSDFKLFGDGSATRDFTYIDDAVTAIIKLSSWGFATKRGSNTAVNIGGGNPSTMSDLIKILDKQTNYNFDTNPSEGDPVDMLRTFADTSLMEQLIQYKPETSLAHGLSKFVEWAKTPEILYLLKRISQ
jgi:UDP-glucuronate 4-epimerase